jgi:hypothetical protein
MVYYYNKQQYRFEEYGLLGCYLLQFEDSRNFRRIIPLPSSGLRSKPSTTTIKAGGKLSKLHMEDLACKELRESHHSNDRYLEHLVKLAVVECSINLGQCIQLQDTSNLFTKSRHINRIIRVVTGIELLPNNMNLKDGFCLSKLWEPLISFPRKCKKPVTWFFKQVGPCPVALWGMESALSVLLDFLGCLGNSVFPHPSRSSPLPLAPFIPSQPLPQTSYIQNLSTPNSIGCKWPCSGPTEVPFPLLPLAFSESTYRQWSLFHRLFDSSLQTWAGLYQATYSTHSSLTLPPASAGFLLGLLFDPEAGGNMFLLNVWFSQNY